MLIGRDYCLTEREFWRWESVLCSGLCPNPDSSRPVVQRGDPKVPQQEFLSSRRSRLEVVLKCRLGLSQLGFAERDLTIQDLPCLRWFWRIEVLRCFVDSGYSAKRQT
jgi:hypothetical protein